MLAVEKLNNYVKFTFFSIFKADETLERDNLFWIDQQPLEKKAELKPKKESVVGAETRGNSITSTQLLRDLENIAVDVQNQGKSAQTETKHQNQTAPSQETPSTLKTSRVITCVVCKFRCNFGQNWIKLFKRV